MPVPSHTSSAQHEAPPALQELDRVKLTETVTAKGRVLRSGMEGTIVYCHGSEAYEVEFPGISDFFQVPRVSLIKA
jgi:hypothetical protein